MNDLYYAYHTQDPEWCVRNILELKNITEKYFDNNYRLKEVMKKQIYNLFVQPEQISCISEC